MAVCFGSSSSGGVIGVVLIFALLFAIVVEAHSPVPAPTPAPTSDGIIIYTSFFLSLPFVEFEKFALFSFWMFKVFLTNALFSFFLISFSFSYLGVVSCLHCLFKFHF